MSDFASFIQEPGTGGGGGGVTLGTSWRFETGTADADPGNRRFRFNDATQANATFLYINDSSDSGVDVASILQALPSGTRIYMQVDDDSASFHLATTTGVAITAVGYTKLPISIDDSGADFANNQVVGFLFFLLGSTDHGALAGLLDDDHTQYLRLLGRATGQAAIGGTGAGEELKLRGSSNANLGLIRAQSPIVFDDVTPANALQPYSIEDRSTSAFTVGFVGGTFSDQRQVTFTNALMIYEVMRGAPTIQSLVAPGFAAFTLFQALPLLRAGPGATHNPLGATVINAGPVVENEFAGSRSVVNQIGFSYSPQARAALAAAVMSVTNQTAMRFSPKFSTVVGSTANLGTCFGVDCFAPAVALFQPGAGAVTLAAYYGLNFQNIIFPSTGDKVVVRSVMTDAVDRFFLRNIGGARSDFGGGDLLNVGIIELLGDTINESILFGAAGDARIYFDGTDLIIDSRVVASPAVVRFPNPIFVTSETFPAATMERTGTVTNAVMSGYRQLATTLNDMVDGFGTSVFWSIQDNANVVNNIGFEAMIRNGADNSGRWLKYVYLAGAATLIHQLDTVEYYVAVNGGRFRTGGGRRKQITRITAGPYALLASDHVLFVDTDGGAVIVNLPAGITNTEYRIVNVGSGGNNVTLTPDGAELLYGAGAFAIADGLEARVGYETTEGWF